MGSDKILKRRKEAKNLYNENSKSKFEKKVGVKEEKSKNSKSKNLISKRSVFFKNPW